MSSDFDIDRILAKISASPPIVLDETEVIKILELVNQIFIKEENMLRLSDPIIVVGDIHGQLYDFLEIFRIEPPPPECQYLFLGDYVDRGYYSLEVLMYLFCLKIKYPDRVHILRGNHESAFISRTYGFYSECLEKFGSDSVWKSCCETFNYLPLAAMISDRIFAVHGGLSPSIQLVDQIAAIDRFQEPNSGGAHSDFLWADPSEHISGFKESKRGAGYLFGGDVTRRFAYLNRLTHITRAHQLAMRGYEFYFDGLLSTVWSAPNYTYRSGNLASVMRISHDQEKFSMKFNIFDAVPENERTVPESKMSQYFL